MSIINDILDSFPDEEFMLIDGFDNAVIGIDTDCVRLVYDVSKIIEILCEGGMDEDKANDYFEYELSHNIPYATNAPILIYTDF
jgi:hypothetical protein